MSEIIDKPILLQDLKNHSGVTITVKCIHEGEIVDGHSYNKDWRRQFVVVIDSTIPKQIVLWNDDIGKIKTGNYYKITRVDFDLYDSTKLNLEKTSVITSIDKNYL